MRISDWSSDVCSSDLEEAEEAAAALFPEGSDFTCRRYPYLEPLVEFKVEGLQYPVGWDPKEPDKVRIANADKEAWADFISHRDQIGRASCRERVCQYVEISVVVGA